MSEVIDLVTRLQQSMNETLARLSALTDEHLAHECGHGCAMGDGVRGLLVHNIDHERMHLGQVHDIRFTTKTMQRDYIARLMAEWLRERASLASALVGLPDEALDTKPDDGGWSIREVIEHTLWYENDSTDHLVREEALPAVTGSTATNT